MFESSVLVSIVIPCYKQAAFLPEAIESALAQTHPQVEVIVVDDGSPDETSSIAAQYQVSCVRQENCGLAGARNAGLHRARGDLVIFLDADDRLLASAVGSGVKAMVANPGWALTFGAYEVIASTGIPTAMSPRPPVDGDSYRWLLRYNWIGMHATVMYRREILVGIGGFDESLPAAEDYDVYLRMSYQFPIGGHEAIIAQYRRHGANMSRRPALMLESVLRVLERQRSLVRDDAWHRKELRAGIAAIKREYVFASARAMMFAGPFGTRRDTVLERLWVILRHGPSVLCHALAHKITRLFGPNRPMK